MDNTKEFLKQLQKLQKNLKEKFDTKSKPVYKKIGERVLPIIKNRWISGKGVWNNGNDIHDLEALDPKTIERRKRKKLDKRTDADKSNLIESGKTIDSVKAYPTNDSLKIESRTREDILKGNAERNGKERVVMNLSKDEINEIEKVLEEELANILKEFN